MNSGAEASRLSARARNHGSDLYTDPHKYTLLRTVFNQRMERLAKS